MALSFKTKLLLLCCVSLLVSMVLITSIAVLGFYSINQAAGLQIEKGLTTLNHDDLQRYIQAQVTQANAAIDKEIKDSQTITQYIQTLVDNKAAFGPLFDTASSLAFFKDDLKFDATSQTFKNDASRPSIIDVFGQNGQVSQNLSATTQTNLNQTTLLDLVLPSAQQNSPEKQDLFYVNLSDTSYVRAVPWATFTSTPPPGVGGPPPGGNANLGSPPPVGPPVRGNGPPSTQTGGPPTPGTPPNGLDDHLRSLVDNPLRVALRKNWQGWVTNPTTKTGLSTEVTFLQPVFDSGEAQPFLGVSQPVWDKTRQHLLGEVSFDWVISQLTDQISSLQIADSGFAFLMQSDGNVLAVNDDGRKLMGLHSSTQGVYTSRKLQDSTVASVASLPIPTSAEAQFAQITISNTNYGVVLQRLAPHNFQSGDGSPITAQSWIVGLLVPKDELLTTLHNTQAEIKNNAFATLLFQVLVSLGILVVVVAVVLWVSTRLVAPFKQLEGAAHKIRQGDYAVQVAVTSNDEIGRAGSAFNAMAQALRTYTSDLYEANQKINSLNSRLDLENHRLKAEVAVTRQIQQMILPKPPELERISGLEIAGFMEPADEVGGDYYDVLYHEGRVKIGIGDVTGHGIESGMLMLMVQMAVRTLLANRELDAAKFLNTLNRAIYANVQRMQSDKNLTLLLLDYKDNNLQLSGQHEEIIIVRANGTLELVDTMGLGFPIGLEENIEPFLDQHQIQLSSGDVVVLYTDGITEAENIHKEQYGLTRLCQVVQANASKSAEEIKQAIIDDVFAYIGSQRVFDDITLLVLKQR
jgi:sigma-B regulation protein RsbU (phosphoserine phosphatase)